MWTTTPELGRPRRDEAQPARWKTNAEESFADTEQDREAHRRYSSTSPLPINDCDQSTAPVDLQLTVTIGLDPCDLAARGHRQ